MDAEKKKNAGMELRKIRKQVGRSAVEKTDSLIKTGGKHKEAAADLWSCPGG